MDGIPLDPYVQLTLTSQQVHQYLERIRLPPSTLDEPPSFELLSKLLLAQLEHIPLDTSPLHIPEVDWEAEKTIELSSNFTGMPEGIGAFERIVVQKKGAFCFSINATFSAFLRAFGFRVSELVGRAFKSLGNDPLTHKDGYKWGTLTHQVMLADWEGSEERYFVDGGWGPWAVPVPIKLSDNETVLGLNPYEAFTLRHEHLPLLPTQTPPIDTGPKGWTLSRRITPPDQPVSLPLDSSSAGYWSPLFHFQVISASLLDFRLYHHFSASHELAVFTAFWLVTKLIPDSGGARRSMLYADKEGKGRRAKVYTTGGHEAKGSLEGRDVEWVEMETRVMKEYLKKEFGFGF